MSNRSRSQRMMHWCRYHPRATGIGVLALIAFVVIGAATDQPKDDAKDTARGNTTLPATTAPASSSPVATGAVRIVPTSSSRPSVTRLRVAPADRDQGSNRLATTVLAALAVKGRAPKTGYDRDKFGTAWTDDNDNPLGRNGCDTRNDILRRDLIKTAIKAGSNGCTVLTGSLRDPYTDTSIAFQRGQSTSRDIQIDHVVALSDAWQKGAQRYDERTRTDLANDPLNLLAVDGPTNGARGDGDAATWLPPNTAYRCSYVARQIAVKARYRLWMTAAEQAAATRVLRSCPRQTVPTESGAPYIGKAPKPTPRTTTRPPPPVTSEPPSNVYYENCDAVRAAGAAPIHAGDPGYDSHLDRDGDGVACK